LIEAQYQRNDLELKPGTFRVHGETLEIYPAYEEHKVIKISFFGDEVERIMVVDSVTGEILNEPAEIDIYPAKHYITQEERLKKAINDIEEELESRLEYFKKETACWRLSAWSSGQDMTSKCCKKLVIAQEWRIIPVTLIKDRKVHTPGR